MHQTNNGGKRKNSLDAYFIDKAAVGVYGRGAVGRLNDSGDRSLADPDHWARQMETPLRNTEGASPGRVQPFTK
jgi:hypothetical protein